MYAGRKSLKSEEHSLPSPERTARRVRSLLASTSEYKRIYGSSHPLFFQRQALEKKREHSCKIHRHKKKCEDAFDSIVDEEVDSFQLQSQLFPQNLLDKNELHFLEKQPSTTHEDLDIAFMESVNDNPDIILYEEIRPSVARDPLIKYIEIPRGNPSPYIVNDTKNVSNEKADRK